MPLIFSIFKRRTRKYAFCKPPSYLNLKISIGAECVNLKGGYLCNCKPEFAGKRCGFDNPCFNHDCKNNAQCQVVSAEAQIYSCDCVEGFNGQRCQFVNCPCMHGKCLESAIERIEDHTCMAS